MDELTGSVTECPLCMEQLSNPKFLPCYHTFCCKCIEQVCRSHDSCSVPCPLCRSMFNKPHSGNCRRMPTNVYAEELVRVSGIVKEANKKHRQVKDELETTKNKLMASEDGRQRAAEKMRRQDAELAETRAELKERSSQIEELRLNLSDVQSRESVLREEQRNTLDERQRVEEEIRRQDAELAETRAELKERSSQIEELMRNLSDAESRKSILREEQQRTLEQLRTAQNSYEAANLEVESYRKAKMETEASLAASKKSCMSLGRQLQQTQRDSSEEAYTIKTKLENSAKEIETLSCQLASYKQREEFSSGFLMCCFCILIIVLLVWRIFYRGSSTAGDEGELATTVSECSATVKGLTEKLAKIRSVLDEETNQ